MKDTKRKILVAASSFASLFALAAGLVFNHGSSMKEVKADGVVTDISTLTADHIAQDGETLTGKMKMGYRLQVADGATVTLDNVKWYDDEDTSLTFPGIELLGDGTLVLSGSNEIDWNHRKYSSIYVPVDKTLTIDAVDDTASLYCWHGDMAAAIGGGTDQDCGNIVINKGVITMSYGAQGSSLIGGGPGGNCGTITINGGNITAKAGWGAAIGSSVGKSVGTITINGGELNVEGDGAAIGPANGGTTSDIIVNGGTINVPAEEEFSRETAALSVSVGHTLYINGGEINVKGGSGSGGWFPTYGAAAIGASGLYACGDIVITGGTINAQGGARAAAIGSGEMFGCGNITIIDGIINATGGENGAGIGAAKDMACGNVVIEGGTVTAVGGVNGAGIGGANGGNGVGLTVNGGTVIATGGENAAGIGGANGGNGGTLTVTGGTVTATGGANGAGVGGGNGGSGSSITFSGGELTATGGANAYGMGSGAGEGLAHGAITITDPSLAVHGGDSSDAMVQQNNYGSTRWQYMKIGLSSHTHNWSYTANGNTITAACSEDDCPVTEGLTLTLEAPQGDMHYDGTAKAASLKEGYSAAAFPDAEIKYFKDNVEVSECVNVGKYTAKVTFGNAVAIVEFEILGKSINDPTNPGATIEIDDVVVPDNIELRVEVRTDVAEKDVAEDYAKITEKLEANEKIVKVYDVKLIQTVGGVEKVIQPSDIKAGLKVTVRMAIPEGVKMANARVLHIHSVDDMEFVSDYTMDGNDLVFKIGRLSQFAFVTKGGAGGLGHGFCIGWVAMILDILFALCAALYIVLRLKPFKFPQKVEGFGEKVTAKEVMLTLAACLTLFANFVFDLIVLIIHQCPVSVIAFVIGTLLFAGIAFWYVFTRKQGKRTPIEEKVVAKFKK